MAINLGTVKGNCVLELVSAFSGVSGQAFAYQFVPCRAGDIASYYASADKVRNLLGKEAKLSITEMCQDTWC